MKKTDIQPLKWEYRIPLLTNRYVMADSFKLIFIVYVLTVSLLGGIVAVGEGWKGFLSIVLGMGLGCSIVLVLMLFVMLFVFGNRIKATFEVNNKGVRYTSCAKVTRIAMPILFVLSLFRGNPTGMGTALMFRNGEDFAFKWKDIRRVTYNDRARVVICKNSWRTLLRLYCSEENYQEVVEIVKNQSGG